MSARPFYCPNTLEPCNNRSQWVSQNKAVTTHSQDNGGKHRQTICLKVHTLWCLDNWRHVIKAKPWIRIVPLIVVRFKMFHLFPLACLIILIYNIVFPPSLSHSFIPLPLSYLCWWLFVRPSPNLTWRDMQHLSVLTSKRNQLHDEVHQWRRNGVGLEFNHLFGYGVLDAGGMVKMAKDWKTVPERFHCVAGSIQDTQWVTFLFFFFVCFLYYTFWILHVHGMCFTVSNHPYQDVERKTLLSTRDTVI